MKTIKKLYPTLNFEQEGRNTPEFLKFAKLFKKEINEVLKLQGLELERFTTGHFYLSGFFHKNDKWYYFSWHNGDSSIMWRTAKSNKDFSGGTNCWLGIDQEMKFNIN